MASTAVPNETDPKALSKATVVVGLGYLFLIVADSRDGIVKIATRTLLKDHLHLGPEQLATFGFLTFFAWYLKPLVGILTDSFPFLGTRRYGYLVVSSGLTALLWILVALLPNAYMPLLIVMTLVNFSLMFANCTLGGILVENGAKFKATGRMSSVRNAAESGGIMIAGLVGGFIAQYSLPAAFAWAGIVMAVLTVVFAQLIREEKSVRTSGIGATLKVQLKNLVTSKTMWIASSFWMLVRFTPGFQTPLYFFKAETLGFSPQLQGLLDFTNSGAGLIGAAFYVFWCRKYPLRKLLYFTVFLATIGAFAYFIYKDRPTAFLVEAISGFTTGLAFLSILDLLSRATPKGCEALGYALIFSFGNLSLAGSDVIGSRWFDSFHKSFGPMIWINSGTTALILLAIPFLPKNLVEHADGHHAIGGAHTDID